MHGSTHCAQRLLARGLDLGHRCDRTRTRLQTTLSNQSNSKQQPSLTTHMDLPRPPTHPHCSRPPLSPGGGPGLGPRRHQPGQGRPGPRRQDQGGARRDQRLGGQVQAQRPVLGQAVLRVRAAGGQARRGAARRRCYDALLSCLLLLLRWRWRWFRAQAAHAVRAAAGLWPPWTWRRFQELAARAALLLAGRAGRAICSLGISYHPSR
jgi:hypothetical protein